MKKHELSWKADENGIMLGARVHDGVIIGLSIINKSVSIQVQRLDSGIVEFELGDTEEWNLTSLCNGSIISTIFVWKNDSVPESTWEIPDSGWNVLYGSRFRKESARNVAKEIIQKFHGYYLIHFSCSYGGDIAAVCKRISVYEDV